MCGIVGVLIKKTSRNELNDVISLINGVQHRRGPDDSGIYVDDDIGLALGHTRLSIQDLSNAGHQPMRYQSQISNLKSQKSEELWITFNGEIYNFLELRKELEGIGHKFNTKTDTEVILAAYAEWGVESFSKLRGMFAFALWDGRSNKLILVKDRYGIKPLYYYSDKEKFLFASTVKALKASKIIPVIKDKKALIGFLLFGSIPLPQTTILNISGVPAGHYLVRDMDGNNELIKYYEPLDHFIGVNNVQKMKSSSSNPDLNHNSFVSKVQSLLQESVQLHMISDAPLGVFLSGGTDSSALALLASKARKNKISTISITFDEEEYSEKKYQDLIVEQIKSDHHEYKVSKIDFEKEIPKIWEAMDEPTIDGVNTYFVAQSAKKAGLKAVLSGLGGDEVFFGYPSFRMAALIRQFQKYPRLARFPIAVLYKLGGKYSKLDYLKSDDILRFYLTFRGLFAVHEISKILNITKKEINNYIDELIVKNGLSASKFNNLEPANILSYLELKFYLQNQLLKDSDVMAMYHSIEIRVPFLDHMLVEYLSNLDASIKLAGTYSKQLLIDSVPQLPKSIYNRRKMGFTFPFEKWLSPKIKTKYELGNAKLHWSRMWALNILERLI